MNIEEYENLLGTNENQEEIFSKDFYPESTINSMVYYYNLKIINSTSMNQQLDNLITQGQIKNHMTWPGYTNSKLSITSLDDRLFEYILKEKYPY